MVFNRKLKGELVEYGLQLNLHDPCVANMITTSNRLLMVLWHVYNLMIQCGGLFEVTKLLRYLTNIHGDKIVAHRDKCHFYLGMDLDFNKEGMFAVSMMPYIDTIVKKFCETITSSDPTPYLGNLFKVREQSEAKCLPEEQVVSSITQWHSFCSLPQEPDETLQPQYHP